MGEIISFISKSERERVRLIREANTLYDSIFPPVDPAGERDGKAIDHKIGGANTKSREGVVP